MIFTGGILASCSAYWMKIRYQSFERPIALFLTYVVLYTIGLMGKGIGNDSWSGEGMISLALLVIAFVLFVNEKARHLWFVAVMQLGLVAFTVWKTQAAIAVGEQFSIGWASIVLALGPTLLFVVSIIASGQHHSR